MDPRSMSRPTVLAPPNPGNLATTPTSGRARKWTVRSSTLPGDVPERPHLRVGPHRGLASDTGVGTEDRSRPNSGPGTYDRSRGDPTPSPHLSVPIHNGLGSQITVAPHD